MLKYFINKTALCFYLTILIFGYGCKNSVNKGPSEKAGVNIPYNCPDTGYEIIRPGRPGHFLGSRGANVFLISISNQTNYASLYSGIHLMLDSCHCIKELYFSGYPGQDFKDSNDLILQHFFNVSSLKTVYLNYIENVIMAKGFKSVDSIFINIIHRKEPYGDRGADLNTIIMNSDSLKYFQYEKPFELISMSESMEEKAIDSMRSRRNDIIFTPSLFKNKKQLHYVEIIWGIDTERYFFNNGELVKVEKSH